MEKFICIHGHFYQPPRENPWLETVELQDSAYPYHDWNLRINAECYATNGRSRILDDQNRILRIVNNYARISFNFGPTLLAWLEDQAPRVYEAILEGDRESQQNFSGHGSAIAQAYNHVILPLANTRDKTTQILWGIRDFERRFQREPEGMWLPETAVDLESLDILSDLGIRFTILAPHQAKRVQREDGDWEELGDAAVDPRVPYELKLPSGRRIALFFYDGPLSRAVAFEGLLSNGETFAQRLLSGFEEDRKEDQLVHIATDGESYGHHHRFGDMALAYALHHIETEHLARLTNYGEFLATHPPRLQAEIFENSSWSCIHGIERWRGDCGCNSGGKPGWTQGWRAPLREALDWLRDTLNHLYEDRASAALQDPWRARDRYIEVIEGRTPEAVADFVSREGQASVTQDDLPRVLKLMEAQRHAMLMYTSCGWFFDDLSGIETVQIIQYAARVIQLARDVFGQDLEPDFLARLGKARSNVAAHKDGREIYDKFVKPAMVDLSKVAAHYSMSSLFEDYDEQASIYCYRVHRHHWESWETGRARLAAGCVTVTSEITRESHSVCFGALHLGDQNLSCGVTARHSQADFPPLASAVSAPFVRADFVETFAELEKNFGPDLYTLRHLFRDEQRNILDIILESTLQEAEASYRQLYEHHAPLLRFLKDLSIPAPKALSTAAEFVLNLSLRRLFQGETFDAAEAQNLLDEVHMEGVSLDEPTLEISVRRKVESLAQQLLTDTDQTLFLDRLDQTLDIINALPFSVNLRKVQNVYYETYHDVYPQWKKRAEAGDEEALRWTQHFASVGEKLSFQLD